jgi:outer membrane protein assembly factor BamE (lipoprotein component of BamABCDE complex)
MGRIMMLLAAGVLLWAACASPGLRKDCLERKQRVDHVAALAASELQVGLTNMEVRALLGEPDEIVAAKGLGEFDIWKYYLFSDCKAYLGLSAPLTELFFLDQRLVKWTTSVQ